MHSLQQSHIKSVSFTFVQLCQSVLFLVSLLFYKHQNIIVSTNQSCNTGELGLHIRDQHGIFYFNKIHIIITVLCNSLNYLNSCDNKSDIFQVCV